MNVYPRQKLTTAQKETVDNITGKNWGQSNIDYFIDQISATEREAIIKQYKIKEGIIEENDYNYILNPFNTTVDNYKRFGSVLRNFDIINPVINLYAGEFNQRFKNTQVLDSNPEDDNAYKEGLNALVKQYYDQESVNQLNALGLETNQPSVEQQPLQEQVEVYNRDFDSNRVITGQEILDYIKYDQDIEDKHQDGYINWLTCGRVFSYKGIFHNDVDYEIINPWEITVPQFYNSNHVEDAPWIVRRQVMSVNQILDRFHDKLNSSELNMLEEKGREDSIMQSTGYVQLPTQWVTNKQEYKNVSILEEISGIEVFHVQWRSWRKVGMLLTTDDIGQPIEIEVDDTYKINKELGDVSIEWDWISEVWEGWRIGDDTSPIYVDIRPLPYNRMELNNKSSQKLSYNGRINKTLSGNPLSIPSIGENYQMLYNILHYQFEKIINKNKDKIAVIPQGLIPKGVGGWDEEKFMYFAHANSMMVVDETSPTAGLAMQGIKVLDMSLGSFAKDSIELMQSVKAEWWEAIGMNRQRYGDSKASDGKAVTEQAIFRSAIISDELNRKFEKFQEKDYAGLLDISKLAFLEGKKGKYINSDYREAFLTLNPDDALYHLESDYNIFVKNSRRENDKLQQAKEYGFSLGQNGDADQMLELIDSSNFTKTKEVVKKMNEFNKQRQESSQQADRENLANIENAKRESEQAEREVKMYVADKDYDKTIDAKLLEINNKEDVLPEDTSEQTKMNNHKISVDNQKLTLDKQDLKLKEKKINADIRKNNNPNN